jgi:hypothetical protein
MITILDLDNCISDDAWRIPTIDWEQQDLDVRYLQYHALSAFDAVGNRELFAGLEPLSCLILTARPIHLFLQTVEWLRRAEVPVLGLMMRPSGDHTPSAKMKLSMLSVAMDQLKIGIEDIGAAYDDRQDIVDMYRSLGIPAERRFIHTLEAHLPPADVRMKMN